MNGSNLHHRLHAVRQKAIACAAATGLSLTIVGVVSLFAIGMTIDWLAELPVAGRAVLLLVNLGLIGAILYRQVIVPVRAAPDIEGAALLVEQAEPQFASRLISTVQLSQPGALAAGESAAMVTVLVAQTESLAGPVNFRAVVPSRTAWWCAAGAAVVLAAGIMAYRLTAPTSVALLQRALLFNVPVPHKTQTHVVTGAVKVAQGDSVIIVATATGIVPPTGKLMLRYGDGRRQQFTMAAVADARATFQQSVENVQESFEYAVKLNDDTSAWFAVQVLERPVVTAIECQQTYPAYTKLGTVRRLATDLTLLAGSRLSVALTANKPITNAALRLAGLNREVPLTVDAKQMTGAFAVPASGLTGFTVQMTDTDGLRTKELALYRIDVLPDKAPTAAITYPQRKEELVTGRATAIIGLEASDDFGVAKLVLHYKCSAIEAGKERAVELDLEGQTPRHVRRRHEWKLAELGALPEGATIEYWLEARDTNDVTGPGIAQTEHFWLKVVSEEDKRADLMNRLDDYLTTIGGVAEDQERLNKNLGAIIFGKQSDTRP